MSFSDSNELKGNPVSYGYAIGNVYIFEHVDVSTDEALIDESSVFGAVKRYEIAKKKALAELDLTISQMQENNDDKADIFIAHRAILTDVAIDEEIRGGISAKFWNTEFAITKIFQKYIRIIERSKDPVFRNRASDLEDVMRRVIFAGRGLKMKTLDSLPGPSVVVCRDLLPSDCLNFDRGNVLAIIAEEGGETSHSTIISRDYEIPAVLCVNGARSTLVDGQTVIVDAVEGIIFPSPEKSLIDSYLKKSADFSVAQKEIKKYRAKDPLMACGKRIDIMLNIGSISPVMFDNEKYVDGIGLMRTEFLYMESKYLPTEDEQFEAYKKVLSAFGTRPVTLRTLDIGGDKTLPYFELPVEENPFLGKRALRLCFDHPDLFRTQLRAAFRASAFGNLWLMLPMVGTIEDIRDAKAIINDVYKELDDEGIQYADNIKIGIMIEIPSIALIADAAVKEIDFASIGSNDLIQYLMAADRMNSGVKKYYQHYNPAVFRLIKIVADAFISAGKPLSICGEIGGDPCAAIVLVGLGLSKLSMNVNAIAPIKKILSMFTEEDAQKIAAKVCEFSSSADSEEYLKSVVGKKE